MFRAAVIAAYGGRCALSGLPEASLLDAAHIAADRDELLSQPVITNGCRSPSSTTPRSTIMAPFAKNPAITKLIGGQV